MKKNPLIGAILQAVVVTLAGLLGWSLTDDSAGSVVVLDWLLSLKPSVQVGILVAVALLLLAPWLAPFTPWTGDDALIKYQSPAKKFFLAIWNSLAGNYGYATNAPPDKIQPKR